MSVYVDNKVKNILILGKSPTQELGGHSLAAEKCIPSILPKLTQIFVSAYIIMDETVTNLLMVQKFTNSKQTIL